MMGAPDGFQGDGLFLPFVALPAALRHGRSARPLAVALALRPWRRRRGGGIPEPRALVRRAMAELAGGRRGPRAAQGPQTRALVSRALGRPQAQRRQAFAGVARELADPREG